MLDRQIGAHLNNERATNESAQSMIKSEHDTLGRMKQSQKNSEHLLKKARDHRPQSQSRSLSRSRQIEKGDSKSCHRSINQNSKMGSMTSFNKSQSGYSRDHLTNEQSKMSVAENHTI